MLFGNDPIQIIGRETGLRRDHTACVLQEAKQEERIPFPKNISFEMLFLLLSGVVLFFNTNRKTTFQGIFPVMFIFFLNKQKRFSGFLWVITIFHVLVCLVI